MAFRARRLYAAVPAALLAAVATSVAALRDTPYDWELSTGRSLYDLPEWLEPLGLATWVFGTEGGVLFCGAAAGIAASRAAGIAIAAGGTLSWLAIHVLKILIDRPRPDALTLEREIRMNARDAGFPSGHAAQALAMLLIALVILELPRWANWSLATLALLVGLARLHAGVHWPLDTLGGWSIGVLSAALVVALESRMGPRQHALSLRRGPGPSGSASSGPQRSLGC